MKRIVTICILAVLGLATSPSAMAQTFIPGPEDEVETAKRGQTGFKFLTTDVDARAAALGGAVTTSTMGSSSALFYNPASMARMDGNFSASAGILDYIVDIRYNVVSAAYRAGNIGVFGVSFMNVDYGDFFETVRANNEQGFIELGTYSPSALAAGFGYARSFTDRFSVGAHVKYALQDLGSFVKARAPFENPDPEPGEADPVGYIDTFEDYALNTFAFDFGILYNTGFRSLTIAMSTRNFAQELVYERERFELPLTFQLGVSMNMIDLTGLNPDMHSFLLSVDAQRPRDFTEHLKIGAEYTLMNVLSLRGGWNKAFVASTETEEGFSLGAGLKYQASGIGFGADYAYTDFGIFGDLQRFAIQISL